MLRALFQRNSIHDRASAVLRKELGRFQPKRVYPTVDVDLLYKPHRRNFSEASKDGSFCHVKTLPNSNSLVLFDSLSGSYKSLHPDTNDNAHEPPKGLAWYTCGPTVYDSAHLGHARTYVAIDIIQRALLYNHNQKVTSIISSANNSKELQLPPSPIFIMNITDVDDKIIQRAEERNVSPLELAKEYENDFFEDMKALNVMYPTIVTRVTDHVDSSIIPYIEKIIENGMAYILPDHDCEEEYEVGEKDQGSYSRIKYGSVYFDVRAFETSNGLTNKYGKLSSSSSSENGEDEEENVESSNLRKETKIKKRDRRDFALWKSRKGDDELQWDSPWGKGRPGWHIECSAMIDSIMDEFQSTHVIQVHAGGIDLKFPHHTNEIAQAEAYRSVSSTTSQSQRTNSKKEWIPHWVHTGHLHIDGLKMSKSLKNFVTVKEILSSNNDSAPSPFESPADDFRLWCLGLSGSYRGPAIYSKARIEEAKVIRAKILRFLADGEEWLRESSQNGRSDCLSRRWSEKDHELLEVSNTTNHVCHQALMGSVDIDSSEGTRSGFDFDGTLYLDSLLSLSELGCEYIAFAEAGNHPIQPIQRCLDTMRDRLSIVGFSEKTVKVGLLSNLHENSGITDHNKSIIDEMVKFRRAIREKALEEMEDSPTLAKQILSVCDGMRDHNLPSLGVEVNDDNKNGEWRFTMPVNEGAKEIQGIKTKENVDRNQEAADHTIENINETNFFKTRHFAGQFSEYDSKYVPTKNVDGTDVSKNLRKKLLKKKDKYFTKKIKQGKMMQ